MRKRSIHLLTVGLLLLGASPALAEATNEKPDEKVRIVAPSDLDPALRNAVREMRSIDVSDAQTLGEAITRWSQEAEEILARAKPIEAKALASGVVMTRLPLTQLNTSVVRVLPDGTLETDCGGQGLDQASAEEVER